MSALPHSLAPTLTSDTKAAVHDWLAVLQQAPDALKVDTTNIDEPLNIAAFVDGRALACPMPLLKTKVALRPLQTGDSVYVLATDPNSCADIAAFCAQSLSLDLNVSTRTNTAATGSNTTPDSDTIFHFIITKTDSN